MTRAQKRLLPERFDRIAGAYDLLAALNPGYRRNLRRSAERLGLPGRARILDLCCGTGLSTRALAEVYPDARIVGLDASAGMLARARKRGGLGRVTWLCGDAADPARAGASGPFDAVFMAYGIRNLASPDPCLRRIRDLLAPGGVAGFHEYSLAGTRRSRLVWNAVAGGLVLPLGFSLTGEADLFRYLRRSVLDFDRVAAFERRLRRAGLADVRSAPMRGWQRGIVHTFLARRPP